MSEFDRSAEKWLFRIYGPHGSYKRDAYEMMTACSMAQFEQDWWRILKNGATATATTATTATATTTATAVTATTTTAVTATTSDAGATTTTTASAISIETRMQEQHLKMIEANSKCAELAHSFAIRVLLGL